MKITKKATGILKSVVLVPVVAVIFVIAIILYGKMRAAGAMNEDED